MERYFGFGLKDLSSPSSFVRLLNRPCDPSSLAVARIFFGILMILDIPEERGLAMADHVWGSATECRFPLIDSLSALPLEWMCMVYLVMLLGAVGITLGAFYKLSCLCFLLPYWYIFLLDKASWNNHSYLYGWLGILLFVSDADRCWSVDGWLNKSKQHTEVPLWNYTLLRGQVFVVYFIAGLKKLDSDWLGGYSMQYLSSHWVFDMFRVMLSDEMIDLYIVHLGGFLLDSSVGFLLFFDETRFVGVVLCLSFHLMNSQMFHIGMFPYMMIATTPLFCSCDWPENLIKWLPKRIQSLLLYQSPPVSSTNCLYPPPKEKQGKVDGGKHKMKNSITLRHKLAVVCVCLHFIVQGFLPYSHSLTGGYNTWTQGPYGYSWDMMVHNWNLVHAKITLIDKQRNAVRYIDPTAWSHNMRWPKRADTLKQFASCIEDRVGRMYNMTDIEIYADVWLSLNGRFNQRVYDPTVDILKAEWSPFKEVEWVLPLLTELSDWRAKLEEITDTINNKSEYTDVIFFADFPGFELINFIQEEISNATLQVLKGAVAVEYSNGTEKIVEENETVEIPTGEFHTVIPMKDSPSCYMYVYVNESDSLRNDGIESKVPEESHSGVDGKNNLGKRESVLNKQDVFDDAPTSLISMYWDLLLSRYWGWKRSFTMLSKSLYHIITNTPMYSPIQHPTS